MMILVTYDVSTVMPAGDKRLRKLSKACRNYGQRVQYSVFEIEVDGARWTFLKQELCDLINPETDSLRFYYFGHDWQRKVEHIGAKPVLDLNGPLVF